MILILTLKNKNFPKTVSFSTLIETSLTKPPGRTTFQVEVKKITQPKYLDFGKQVSSKICTKDYGRSFWAEFHLLSGNFKGKFPI